jgi:hypothetical protein
MLFKVLTLYPGIANEVDVLLGEDFLKYIFWYRLECVSGPSFTYVEHLVFLRDAWIRTPTESCRIASSRAANLATHLPLL